MLADEAYYHFHGETVLDCIGSPAYPNLAAARTFSKAYGLAGLRLGLLAAGQDTMRWLRRVISPYSVNALALACLPAALGDRAYLDWYVGEVQAARQEFYTVCAELCLRAWPSEANFVLLEIGPAHREFTRAMHERGVLVRDRSADPGCDGCVRVTIGTREQMRRSHEALRAAVDGLRRYDTGNA